MVGEVQYNNVYGMKYSLESYEHIIFNIHMQFSLNQNLLTIKVGFTILLNITNCTFLMSKLLLKVYRVAFINTCKVYM